jgi:phospholipid/cholesterol/gamma-HCH transport system ATP-binding protein
MIQIQNVQKSFGDNQVLRGVDLNIETGQCVVVLGGSGCGKSVLLKLIMGLLACDAGSILVEGKDVTAMDLDDLYEIRKKFGMVFQGAALFDSLTVEENVGLGLRKHTLLSDAEIRDSVAEKLQHVGLSGVQRLKPSELSGGMKKRVSLARAIAMSPKYVLYDEPTTGLDPIVANSINDLISDLKKKLSVTSIVVTHDLGSAARVADKVSMLYKGKMVFDGGMEELLSSENVIVKSFIEGGALRL